MALELPMMTTEDVDAMMQTIAWNLDRTINGPVPPDKPRRNGFCLLVFPVQNHMGQANFITSVEKPEAVCLLKCQLARLEGQTFQAGHA